MGGLLRPDPRQRFGKEAVRRLKTALPAIELHFDEQTFSVHWSLSGEDGVAHLDKFYFEVQQGASRGAVLDRFVKAQMETIGELPALFSDARHRLLPRIQNRLFREHLRLTDVSVSSRVVGERLVEVLALDRPTSVVYVTDEQLDNWHVTADEAFEVARSNLRIRRRRPLLQPVRPGLWYSPRQDSWDASTLLSWPVGEFEVSGEPVVLVPNADNLLLTGAEDNDGLAELLKVGRAYLHAPKPLCGLPLVCRESGWEPFVPAPEHPLFGVWNQLRIDVEGRDYAEQGILLEELHKLTGEDLWVGIYGLVKNRSDPGRSYSWSAWGEGVTGLLPRTDRVAVMRKGKEPVMYDFESVVQAVGRRLQVEPDCWPVRYRLSTYPTDEEIEQFVVCDFSGSC